MNEKTVSNFEVLQAVREWHTIEVSPEAWIVNGDLVVVVRRPTGGDYDPAIWFYKLEVARSLVKVQRNLRENLKGDYVYDFDDLWMDCLAGMECECVNYRTLWADHEAQQNG